MSIFQVNSGLSITDQDGGGSNATVTFIATGAPTTADVDALIAGPDGPPSSLDGTPRTSVRKQRIGDSTDSWRIVASYGDEQDFGSTPVGGSFTSFSTAGGTQHITQSLATLANVARPGQQLVDYEGAIGVSSNGVDGVDIFTAAWSEERVVVVDEANVTGAFKSGLFSATGRVNSDIFIGFNPGELLFVGADGSQRGQGGDFEIRYSFRALPNRTGIQVIPGSNDIVVNKDGWDLLDPVYEEVDDPATGRVVIRPVQAKVERVYERTTFADKILFI